LETILDDVNAITDELEQQIVGTVATTRTGLILQVRMMQDVYLGGTIERRRHDIHRRRGDADRRRPARASAAYTLTLEQEGSVVVATGSGSIDSAGLNFLCSACGDAAQVRPNTGY
jgi:hypothetical protein